MALGGHPHDPLPPACSGDLTSRLNPHPVCWPCLAVFRVFGFRVRYCFVSPWLSPRPHGPGATRLPPPCFGHPKLGRGSMVPLGGSRTGAGRGLTGLVGFWSCPAPTGKSRNLPRACSRPAGVALGTSAEAAAGPWPSCWVLRRGHRGASLCLSCWLRTPSPHLFGHARAPSPWRLTD